MRIERIEIYHVSMPLIYPFRTAFGNDEAIESILVRMQADGLSGWGEAAAWKDPAFCSEWAAGQFLLIRERLAPRLIGQDIASGRELQDRLAMVRGNHFAKAALDLAWWDLHARSRSEPLWKTLGGRSPIVDVGADFGVMDSVDQLMKTIGQAVKAGFKRVKLKYRPGWELDMLGLVREAFPKMSFHVDCNSAYTLADAKMLKELDRFDLAMIEQPLMHDDLIDHAKLAREISTPICLDESITSLDKARQAVEIGACRWVNIKLGRVGGITNAIAIHDFLAKAGVPCWIGSMVESAVGAAHNIAVATLGNVKYPSDIFPSDRFYDNDLGAPSTVMSGPSQISAQAGPGIGVEPKADLLQRATLERAVLS